MKGVTVELDNEMPLHPLYPTWFRWKKLDGILDIEPRDHFISHMVQMKAMM